MGKRTHEQFVQKVIEKVGYDKYEFLTEYQGSESKITIRCKEDGYVWTIVASAFLGNKCKCPKCSNCVMNKDTDYFKNQLKELYGDEYICLGEYTKAKNKILIKHNVENCGNEFMISPDSIINKKNGCPICNHRKGADKLFVSNEEFCKRVNKLFNGEFEILSPYKGGKEKVTVRHIPCGRVYDRQAGDMLQGKGCKFCGFGATKDTQWIKEKVFGMYQGEYEVLGEYISSSTPILIKHNKCGKEYNITTDSFLHGTRCKCESTSKGEKIIEIFLKFNKIKFKQQYTYSDCKNKARLPFDVAVKDINGQVIFLIEYDGEQHYEPIYGELQFADTKYNDALKNSYCEDNNIPLLRIPYWEFDNINLRLVEYFKQFNISTFIPTGGLNIWEEGNQFKLIKILKELPNGIYPKKYIINKLESSTVVASLTELLNIDCVKEIINELNINYTNLSLSINNNYKDYVQYFEILTECKKVNEENITKWMNTFHYLYLNKDKINNKLFKKDIFTNMNCIKALNYSSHEYKFVEEFMNDYNLYFEHNYVCKQIKIT